MDFQVFLQKWSGVFQPQPWCPSNIHHPPQLPSLLAALWTASGSEPPKSRHFLIFNFFLSDTIDSGKMFCLKKHQNNNRPEKFCLPRIFLHSIQL